MPDGRSSSPSVTEAPTGPRSFVEAKAARHKARLAGMNPNYWYPLEWSDRVAAGEVSETRFWGQSIAVFRGEDGRARAVENRCAHRQIELTMGHVRGCDLVCLYHGWRYDERGCLVGMSHDHFGKRLPVVSIRAYPVRERYGIIWGFMGDPAFAEQVPLVELAHAEGPDAWASVSFDYTWRAHHYMVIDNLCNLTHLYVHGRWVPYGETTLADHSLDGERIELRWAHTLRRDPGLYAIYKRVFGSPSAPETSDTHMVYDYPYQRALSNDRIRSCNFMLPEAADRTRVFTVQLWQAPKLPGLERRVPLRVMQGLVTPLIKPITKEIFRQDGDTVEGEQRAVMGPHFDKPMPEPNPSVRLFERLTIERWQAVLDAEQGGEAPVPCTRVKRL